MDQEVILALIFKKMEERLKALPPPSRGPRGQRGARGLDGKDFIFSEHRENFRILAQEAAKEESLKISDLSEKELELLRGPRGRDGRDGKDLNFSEHEETIKSWIKDFSLKFSDLSADQIESLRGPRGREGRSGVNGKDFDFSEHEPKIKSWINELSLKFEDLSAEQIDKIRGPKGRDGADGRDFDLEHSRESITELIRGLIKDTHDSFKLKFQDLTLEDIEKIRGPRGRDGRNGRDFVFEDHKDFFSSLRPKFSDFTEKDKEEITLRFSHLTEEQKFELKLKFEDLTDQDKIQLKGPRGHRGQRGLPGRDGRDGKDGLSIRGLPGPTGIKGINGKDGRDGKDGKDGRDGKDGKDAPYIIDIKIDQYKQDKFVFVFEFSDQTEFRTDPVNLPRPNVYISSAGASRNSSSSGGGGALGASKKEKGVIGVYNGTDTVYTLTNFPISDDETIGWLDGVMRSDYTLVGSQITFEGQDTTSQVFDVQYRYWTACVPSFSRKIKGLVGIYSGGDTTYTLPEAPLSDDELLGWLNGILRTDFDLVGSNVIFTGQDTTGHIFDVQYRY